MSARHYMEKLVDSVVEPISGAAPTPGSDLPYATHAGVLRIGGIELRCYVLNTGDRIFDADRLLAALAAGAPIETMEETP